VLGRNSILPVRRLQLIWCVAAACPEARKIYQVRSVEVKDTAQSFNVLRLVKLACEDANCDGLTFLPKSLQKARFKGSSTSL
jgi:hypothetical protein